MRLTLRTLLAYLDDALEPHETREIGKKIQESPVAAAMVSRVREVIRRRRLGAPDVDGPSQGVDPNIVAQYLDNTLSPEQVTQFEAICLESDLILAEAAACHQVLSLILGEPVEVPVRSRERFYAIGPVSADTQLQVDRPDAPQPQRVVAEKAPVVIPAAPVSESAGYFRDEIANQLKPAPWSQRVGPAAGAALVIVAVVLVLALDRDLFRGMVKPQPARDNTVANADTPRVRPVSPDRAAPDKNTAPNGTKITPEMAPVEGNANSPLANLDPTPPPDVPEPNAKPPVKPPVSADVADAVTVLPRPVKPVITAPTPRPVEPAPIVVPMQSVGQEGILLRFNPGDQHWYVQPRRSDLHALETFACPEPYEATFEWDKGDLKATLLGETTLQVLTPTEEQRYSLLIRRGRVILQPGPMAKVPLSVAVQVGGKTHEVTLATAATIVGIEVTVDEPVGLPRENPPDPWHAVVYVAAGSAELADGKTVGAKQFAWLTAPAAGGNLTAASLWPGWLDPIRRDQLSPLRRFAANFEKEFDPTLAVDLSIPPLMRDPRPQVAELAVRCLAITESYQPLIQALVQSDHEEARAAAAAGLRTWLMMDPGNGAILKTELRNHLPEDEARPVERLLWGYTPAEAQDRLVSIELVEWLRSHRKEVRELAFKQLVQLTGRRYDYRPLGTTSQREPAVQRWEAHLAREGALLKPDE